MVDCPSMNEFFDRADDEHVMVCAEECSISEMMVIQLLLIVIVISSCVCVCWGLLTVSWMMHE
jgi:hypothetical protein